MVSPVLRCRLVDLKLQKQRKIVSTAIVYTLKNDETMKYVPTIIQTMGVLLQSSNIGAESRARKRNDYQQSDSRHCTYVVIDFLQRFEEQLLFFDDKLLTETTVTLNRLLLQ